MTNDIGDLAVQLGTVLASVESGELSAGPDQTAWLRGAVAALQMVSGDGVSLPR